jgi:hypothetical protein
MLTTGVSCVLGAAVYLNFRWRYLAINIEGKIGQPTVPQLFGKQEEGIWWVQKRFPRYGIPIWSLWPNIRSLPSIVAEKNVHICSRIDSLMVYTFWWNFNFSFKSYGEESLYKYCMNVDDGRIMRSWRSCLFTMWYKS